MGQTHDSSSRTTRSGSKPSRHGPQGAPGSRPTGRARRRAGAGRAAARRRRRPPTGRCPSRRPGTSADVRHFYSGDDAGVDLFGWLRHGSTVASWPVPLSEGPGTPGPRGPRRRPTPQRRRAPGPPRRRRRRRERTRPTGPRPTSCGPRPRPPAGAGSPRRSGPLGPARPARRPGDPPRAVRPRARPGPRRAGRGPRAAGGLGAGGLLGSRQRVSRPCRARVWRGVPRHAAHLNPARATSSIQTRACTWVPARRLGQQLHRVEHRLQGRMRPGRRGWPRERSTASRAVRTSDAIRCTRRGVAAVETAQPRGRTRPRGGTPAPGRRAGAAPRTPRRR